MQGALELQTNAKDSNELHVNAEDAGDAEGLHECKSMRWSDKS